MTKSNQPFNPNWVSPPGETIADITSERGWTQAELAKRLGVSTKFICQLINGKVALTNETAYRLEVVLGASADFWLTREAHYQSRRIQLDAQERCRGWSGWLDELPVAFLKNIGVLPNVRLTKKNAAILVETCLHFFGVATPEQWRDRNASLDAAFRRSTAHTPHVGALATWLRLGERVAEASGIGPYSRSAFERILPQLRSLTTLPPSEAVARAQEMCRSVGVHLILVPYISNARVSGVARWLGSGNPVIQLSSYGKTNDKFWFTFFHEVAHVLKHANSDRRAVFLDDFHSSVSNEQEREADAWAASILIPSEYNNQLPTLTSKSRIVEFANLLAIHTGIVIGRLQHDGIVPHSRFNDLKTRIESPESTPL
jgi:HTH-type transcriptional regulator/antitoxin HigA